MLKAKTSLAWFAAVVFICSGVARAQDQPLPKPPSDAEYRVCTGDVLEISVYQHPELSRAVVVTHEGTITLPSVKSVKAVGLSPMSLASLLRDKLQSVMPEAQVTVMVKVHHGPPVPLRREPWPRDITPPDHQGFAVFLR
jgi:protein involved in polysaccharide export with SLBB domain